MRNRIIIGLAILAVMVFGIIYLKPAKPRAGPWRLPDGSELSLAGVTYGSKHTLRYGPVLADYIYPILTPALRKKFGFKAMSLDTVDSNGLVVWFWHRRPTLPMNAISSPQTVYSINLVDENGVEGRPLFGANVSTIWRGSNVLQGWELKQFPWHSREIIFRIYSFSGNNKPQFTGEFKVPNRARRPLPTGSTQPLPITVQTNGLEVSLTAFETLLSHDKNPTGTKAITRAVLNVRENQQWSENWSVGAVVATSVSGELPQSIGSGSDKHGESVAVEFPGMIWPEEYDWKLRVELMRITNFPPEELWTLRAIPVPKEGEVIAMNLKTNIYGSEIELVELVGRNKHGPLASAGMSFLHTRSPLLLADIRFRMVEVRDDRGRVVEVHRIAYNPSTGGRGATIREVDEFFSLKMAKDARTLQVTTVFAKNVYVDFVARPKVVKEVPGLGMK